MKILLSTLHAKYVHSSLALPALAAAGKDLAGCDIVIREFTVNDAKEQVLRRLVAEEAELVAFSCYIWNVEATLRLAADLKQLRPATVIILGGPEVSWDAVSLLAQHPAVDAVIRGEGEATFRELVAALQRRDSWQCVSTGITFRSGAEIIATPDRDPVADLDTLPSPFAASLVDLGKPLVYYETSRGCPFSCAFCMSSLEKGVRSYSMARIEGDLLLLMAAGVQTIKLVDRTFNFDAARANRIWSFILQHNRQSRFHFEIAADLLTDDNLALLETVPAGMFRFEIGVQSGEAETLRQVARKSDLKRLYDNVRQLRAKTGVTVHLDLVAGLPGEDFAGFLRSLQLLFELLSTSPHPISPGEMEPKGRVRDDVPHHIQVEPLKVLKGSPMREIAQKEQYAFAAAPPYKILQTPWLSFEEIGRIETIARLLDLYHNSGRFSATLAVAAEELPLASFFNELACFWEKDELPAHLSREHLFTKLWQFGSGALAAPAAETMREALCYDYCLADYPAGELPAYFSNNGLRRESGKVAMPAVVRTLGIAPESRVRTFAWRFARDYRRQPWSGGEVDLLFVYVSAPGKGLRVEVVVLESILKT